MAPIKNIALIAGFVTVFGIAIYPIIIEPRLHPEKYSKCVVFTLIGLKMGFSSRG